MDQRTSVAVDRKRQHWIGESFTVPIQVQARVEKRVRHGSVIWPVAVRHVEAVLEQARREIFACAPVPGEVKACFCRFIPGVGPLVVFPGFDVERVVRQDLKRGYAIFSEILVVVVAPDQDQVRVEGVELGTSPAETFDQRGAVLI